LWKAKACLHSEAIVAVVGQSGMAHAFLVRNVLNGSGRYVGSPAGESARIERGEANILPVVRSI